MFLGTHRPRLDEKGRLILPAKYRDELAAGLVLAKGQERCLSVYPLSEFQRVTEVLSARALPGKETRDFARMLFASASDEQPDKQGRITIPAELREYAGLDRDVTVIGAVTRLEIWDAQTWASYSDQQEDSFAARSEEVLPGGL